MPPIIALNLWNDVIIIEICHAGILCQNWLRTLIECIVHCEKCMIRLENWEKMNDRNIVIWHKNKSKLHKMSEQQSSSSDWYIIFEYSTQNIVNFYRLCWFMIGSNNWWLWAKIAHFYSLHQNIRMEQKKNRYNWFKSPIMGFRAVCVCTSHAYD